MVSEFLPHYVNPEPIEIPNDTQPIMLHDEIIEEKQTKCIHPRLIPLILSRKKIKKLRAVRAI